MKKDWLKDINERMTDYEVDEPHGLWEQISSASNSPLNANSSRKKRKAWIWWGAGIATAACTTLLLYIATNDIAPQNPHLNINKLETQHQQAYNPVQEKEYLDDSSTEHTYSMTNQVIKHVVVSNVVSEAAEIQSDINTNKKREYITTKEDSDSINTNTDINNSNEKYKQKINLRIEKKQLTNKIKKSSKKGLSFGLSTSGGFAHSQIQGFPGDYIYADIPMTSAEWLCSPMLGIMNENRGIYTERKVKHHTPLRLGLSFSYRLNDKWSIESGVNYAKVSSDFQDGSYSHYILEDQELHYVGIPLGISYKIISWKNFDVYISPFIMAEQCVKAQTQRKFVINGKQIEEETEKIASHPLQCSMGLKAGLQYNFNKNLSAFAEPSCNYYFDDHSKLETIFKEKQFDVNLNVGVRITLNKQ